MDINTEETMTELEALDYQCSSLFDMLLEFEKIFCTHALDVVGLTDEQAEKLANFGKSTDGVGVAYRELLKQVKHERIIRKLSAVCDAVDAANPNRPEMMPISEVYSEYAKMNPGKS